MTNTATRLFALIQLLQSRPNQKAAELAAALGVSVRTLHRYMGMLDEMGIPIYTERGRHGGFSLTQGYRMPPLVFSPEEAAVLALGAGLAADLFGTLYVDAARTSLAKLENVLPDSQRREVAWARRSLVTTGLHRSDLEIIAPYLETLRQSIRAETSIFLQYSGAGQVEPTRRSVDPYALVFRWGWWYLIGFCHLRQGLRSFRVDRIRQLSALDKGFRKPPDFDVRRYLKDELEAMPLITVSLRFNPMYAHLAQENALTWDSLVVLEDGSVDVSLKAPDVYWGASMALGYGPAVVVTGPLEVQRVAAEWAGEVWKRYQMQSLK